MFAALGCGLEPKHNQEQWAQRIWTKWERLREQCKDDDSVLPCMAVSAMTGAGKTVLNVVFAWHCLVNHHASKVIYCAHTKDLLKQAYDTWKQSTLAVAVLFGKGSYICEQRVKLFFERHPLDQRSATAMARKYKTDVETIGTAIQHARDAQPWEDPSTLFASHMKSSALQPSEIKKLFEQVCCDKDSPNQRETSGFALAKSRCVAADAVLMTYAAWFTYETVFDSDTGVCQKIWPDIQPRDVLCVLDEGDQARTAFSGVLEKKSICWTGFSQSQVDAAAHLYANAEQYNRIQSKFALAEKGKLTFPEPRDQNVSISRKDRKVIQEILQGDLNAPSQVDLQAANQLFSSCSGTLQQLFSAAQQSYDIDQINNSTILDTYKCKGECQLLEAMCKLAKQQCKDAGRYACLILAQTEQMSVTRAERVASTWNLQEQVSSEIKRLRECAVKCANLQLKTVALGEVTWYSVECAHTLCGISETLHMLRTAFGCNATELWRDTQWGTLVPSIRVCENDPDRFEFVAVPCYSFVQKELRCVWEKGWAGVLFTSATLHDCCQGNLTKSFKDFWTEVNMLDANVARDQIRFPPVFECRNMRVVNVRHLSLGSKEKTKANWGRHFIKPKSGGHRIKLAPDIQAMHNYEADVIANEVMRAGPGAKVLIVGPSFSRIQVMWDSLELRLPEKVNKVKIQFIDHRKDKVLDGIVDGAKQRGDAGESPAVQIVFGSKGVATGLDRRWDVVVLLQRINPMYPGVLVGYETGNDAAQDEIQRMWRVETMRESRQACGRLMRSAQSRGTLVLLDPLPRNWFLTHPHKNDRDRAMVLFPGCTHETAVVEPAPASKRRCV